jgi:hypothetical protein
MDSKGADVSPQQDQLLDKKKAKVPQQKYPAVSVT